MRFSALLLAAFIGTAVAQNPTGESVGLTGPVDVFLKSDNAVSPTVLDAMRREVEAIVSPTGVRVIWSYTADSKIYSRIAVMRLRGECISERPPIPMRLSGSEPLGQTYVSEGRVLSFADVRCDSIRAVIDRDVRAAQAGDRDELLGRAMGRVLAHELYHVLLRTTSHGRNGLARPVQTRSDLLAIHETFSPADQQKLSEALIDDSFNQY